MTRSLNIIRNAEPEAKIYLNLLKIGNFQFTVTVSKLAVRLRGYCDHELKQNIFAIAINLLPYKIKENIMWKIAVGFILFAALALFIIFKAGDKVDMQGESGAPTELHTETIPAASSLPAPAPQAEAAAASASK